MSRQDALDEANARRAELAKVFQKPPATVTEAVKIQPPVSNLEELVATARAAKLQRTEKASSIRMKRLHRRHRTAPGGNVHRRGNYMAAI